MENVDEADPLSNIKAEIEMRKREIAEAKSAKEKKLSLLKDTIAISTERSKTSKNDIISTTEKKRKDILDQFSAHKNSIRKEFESRTKILEANNPIEAAILALESELSEAKVSRRKLLDASKAKSDAMSAPYEDSASQSLERIASLEKIIKDAKSKLDSSPAVSAAIHKPSLVRFSSKVSVISKSTASNTSSTELEEKESKAGTLCEYELSKIRNEIRATKIQKEKTAKAIEQSQTSFLSEIEEIHRLTEVLSKESLPPAVDLIPKYELKAKFFESDLHCIEKELSNRKAELSKLQLRNKSLRLELKRFKFLHLSRPSTVEE